MIRSINLIKCRAVKFLHNGGSFIFWKNLKHNFLNSERFLWNQLSLNAAATKETKQPNQPISFAKLLKNSPFIQLGDPNGVVVVGTIIETLDDNLYIDFGTKFHCVCKKPRYKSDLYTRGTKVRLRLIDFELASKFMGSDRGISLMEADAILLGLDKDGANDIKQNVNRHKKSGRRFEKSEKNLNDDCVDKNVTDSNDNEKAFNTVR